MSSKRKKTYKPNGDTCDTNFLQKRVTIAGNWIENIQNTELFPLFLISTEYEFTKTNK